MNIIIIRIPNRYDSERGICRAHLVEVLYRQITKHDVQMIINISYTKKQILIWIICN